MIFKDELERAGKIIDLELEKVLKCKTGYQERIFESINYSLFTGGKRLRPIMALKSCEMFTNDFKDAIPFALAIEMIHTYSLIHDDLPSMDNDDFRRGKPTNHKIFGEAMAILSGDGLLNLAFEIMLDYAVNDSKKIEDYDKYLKAIHEISKYSGIYGMIGGQVVDLLSNYETMDKDKLLFMYKTKTAALIQSALVSGAIVGNASKTEVEIMREYGFYLGLAYQIRDDILDMEHDSEINKLTYLAYYDKEKAEQEISVLSNKAIATLNELEDRDTSFFKSLTEALVNRKK
jgi:geranylgeranyl diphosphate synthase type II